MREFDGSKCLIVRPSGAPRSAEKEAKSEGAGCPLTYADDPADNVANVVRSTFSRKRA